MLDFCDDKDSQMLLLELLYNFHYLTNDKLIDLLVKIATYIVEESGFQENRTQIAATAYDKQADSSQAVIQLIKVQLKKKGWGNVQTVNSIGNIIKTINKNGLNQIILIDEFIGSGVTLSGRINYLKKSIPNADYEIKCCFMAGIDMALKKISNESGVEIFCPLILQKGISDRFDETESAKKIFFMKEIEKKLEISDEKYSLGYNQAEALYSAEGVGFNTPNSVFPIFWWDIANGTRRKTLLNRYEKDLT